MGFETGRFSNRLVTKGMAKTLINFLELMELMHPFLLQWNLYATAIPGKRFIGGPPSGSNASGLEAVTVLEETIHF